MFQMPNWPVWRYLWHDINNENQLARNRPALDSPPGLRRKPKFIIRRGKLLCALCARDVREAARELILGYLQASPDARVKDSPGDSNPARVGGDASAARRWSGVGESGREGEHRDAHSGRRSNKEGCTSTLEFSSPLVEQTATMVSTCLNAADLQ